MGFTSSSRRGAGAGALLAAGLLAVSACASSGSKAPASSSVAAQSAATVSTAPPTSATAAPARPTLAVGTTTKLGPVVVDQSGRTTYVFDKDTPGTTTSACVAACASLWPAVTVTGSPTAATGISGTVGVITRPDGTRQVTLNGRPLYVFSGDHAAGDANGDGIAGIWHAARPTPTAAATATTPTTAPPAPQKQAPVVTAPRATAPPATPARTVPPTAPPPTAPPTTRPAPPTYPPTTGGGGYGY
jgi:predicted lipoprotein with Yx(FWY)xxD motif